MREKLKEREGRRGTFTATVEHFGTKTSYGYVKATMLVRDVRDESGEQVTDHLWFTVGKQIEEQKFKPGERIKFVASVRSYLKGYKGRREDEDLPPIEKDFCLKFAAQFRRVSQESEPLPVLFSELENLGL